ncbi:HECT-domain-containing protein [Pestalotiopsis sp. NC0098]|nr:HECT-domain-containing protein [Pestalotiopsis sp. NC0098]
MTNNTDGRAACRRLDSIEAEILGRLWEEVPFPRLPSDAPPELKELVVTIENPKKVYTIRRAIRRHDVQLLLERFIVQFRYGCGVDDCRTASCFSCRRRLAGKAPIRRYSPTSARILAAYCVSQDNPEQDLCPNLDPRHSRNDATKSLIFGPKLRSTSTEVGDGQKSKRANGRVQDLSPDARSRNRRHLAPGRDMISNQGLAGQRDNSPSLHVASQTSAGLVGNHQQPSNAVHDVPEAKDTPSQQHNADLTISINERPVRKDYRSFAANVFGSVAFKMLEWLSPDNLQTISDKSAAALENRWPNASTEPSSTEDSDDDLFVGSTSSADHNDPTSSIERGPNGEDGKGSEESMQPAKVEQDHANFHRPRSASLSGNPNSAASPVHPRTNPQPRLRASTLKQRPIVTDPILEAGLNGSLGASAPPLSPISISTKHVQLPIRTSSPVAHEGFTEQSVDEAAVEQGLSVSRNDTSDKPREPQDHVKADQKLQTSDDGIISSLHEHATSGESNTDVEDLDARPDADVLPQSMSRLNMDVVDFFCDMLEQDGTGEKHVLEPRVITRTLGSSSREKALKRRDSSLQPYPRHLKLEWKLFVEQSIYSVLSDPYAVLDSFTTSNGLFDSQTMWYHMLRLTRTAPNLVFDSLWQASASLFSPPRALRSAQSKVPILLSRNENYLSNQEAGHLISICFHALVAAAPLVGDATQLFDMSRIRSRGLTLSESGAVARQSSSLCLHYEDAFTDEMAIRLARRVLAAIPTRRYFDELMEVGMDSEDGTENPDVLDIMLSHLEPGREQHPSSDFSFKEREIHEKRVPILLLDWARTIMLDEWKGRPDVPGDGAFGGALALVAAMHQKRKSLLLGDAIFRIEYFGDRLDSIEMPVTWLPFDSTRQAAHLLDYPYMFPNSSLVSYFRAINFSRMSRSFEESSSLQTRISAIIAMDSLVTDAHQKGVLQDLLKVASAKYLILDIGRKTVIRDAFDQLWRRQERELLRPLKVHLGEDAGEEGFDSGGVQQEFFRLAMAEAMNPDYGAFTIDERTWMTWFQPGLLQPEWKYELVGLLVSLAVFNGLTLPITFPKALYMKILGEPVTELHHISDGWPDLASGLTNLLEWNESDGAVEDIFARTYEFSVDVLGQPVSRQMGTPESDPWPQFSQYPSDTTLASGNPEDAPLVTADNREAYVSDYIRYLTDVSIAPQYEAFARGFRACLHPKSLQLLTPTLLQSIVEGTQEIDIGELRRATRYTGWDASHRTIRDFWSIVKRYDDNMKRKLLEFVTASDRVPVGGTRNIQFHIQKNGAEEGADGHLPTAYTCYGILLLPEYQDKEVLRERLGMALENAQGFGFA